MVAFLGLMMGVRIERDVAVLCVLCATTMLFGWMTEVYSSGKRVYLGENSHETVPICGMHWQCYWRWDSDSWSDRLLWHHFLGYLPFAMMVALILDSYFLNRQAVLNNGEEWPAYVDWSVWGTIVLFSGFGITQLLQQLSPHGPSWYWVGEVSYVVLSFTAKAFLVLLASFNALLPTSRFDDLLNAEF